MVKIGLTGAIGSGKTTVSRVFEALNIPVFRADESGRRMLELAIVKDKLLNHFGSEILSQEGAINRAALASRVFSDKEALTLLNSWIHPLVMADFQCWQQLHHDAPYCIHEAAILIESGLLHHFDYLIVVTASEELRIQRVMQRDNLSLSQVNERIQNQMPDEERIRFADFIILNDGNRMILDQVLQIHKQFPG